MQGLIHLYTGEGKGKTTAAIGLAIRAAGSGKRVLFGQFMKGNATGELSILSQTEGIEICRLEKNFGFVSSMNETEKEEITKAHTQMLKDMIKHTEEGLIDVLVMDELTYVYTYGLIDTDMLTEFLKNKPDELEIVITGRNPMPVLYELADYITDMQCVRHPYGKGVAARQGIEF